jgi:hypothetical protein
LKKSRGEERALRAKRPNRTASCTKSKHRAAEAAKRSVAHNPSEGYSPNVAEDFYHRFSQRLQPLPAGTSELNTVLKSKLSVAGTFLISHLVAQQRRCDA